MHVAAVHNILRITYQFSVDESCDQLLREKQSQRKKKENLSIITNHSKRGDIFIFFVFFGMLDVGCWSTKKKKENNNNTPDARWAMISSSFELVEQSWHANMTAALPLLDDAPWHSRTTTDLGSPPCPLRCTMSRSSRPWPKYLTKSRRYWKQKWASKVNQNEK